MRRCGLCYYRSREYASTTGRFFERDPAGLRSGANLYQYDSSSPTVRRDPLGLNDIGSKELSRTHVEMSLWSVCHVATSDGMTTSCQRSGPDFLPGPGWRPRGADECEVVEVFLEWDIVKYLITDDYQYGTHERTGLGRVAEWWDSHISIASGIRDAFNTGADLTLRGTIGAKAMGEAAEHYFAVDSGVGIALSVVDLAAMYFSATGWRWVTHDGHNEHVETWWENFHHHLGPARRMPCDRAPVSSFPCTHHPDRDSVTVDLRIPADGSEGNYKDGPPPIPLTQGQIK